MNKIEKVVAYIYRTRDDRKEVLVFDHPNVPEVNPQVPAGTIQDGESPLKALLREIEEESGLKFENISSYPGEYEYNAIEKSELHIRHVFEIESTDLPDQWTHQVKSDDEDNGEVFDYYWLSLEKAKNSLVADQGKQLPEGNGHFIKSSDIVKEFYNEELNIGGLNSNLSQYFGLKRIAAHYFSIPSGYRSSEPHAESLEEEFVYVISGEIDLWFNGKIKKMIKGDCIGFPAGTGVGHCFINNYKDNCELFVSGDRTKSNNQYHFHLDPSLKVECGDKWWDELPHQELGDHDGLPGDFSEELIDNDIKILNAFNNVTNASFSYPGDTETFSDGLCLSRHFDMKNVAIWFERMPVGKRTSWPHAHSHEEEFVFVLEGTPTIYLNKKMIDAESFMGIDFKAGSGVAHTLTNNSDDYVYYLCVGECDSKEDKIYYPEHPNRNEEMKKNGSYWEIE